MYFNSLFITLIQFKIIVKLNKHYNYDILLTNFSFHVVVEQNNTVHMYAVSLFVSRNMYTWVTCTVKFSHAMPLTNFRQITLQRTRCIEY